MTFKIQQLGVKKVMLALQRVEVTAPKMMKVIGDEADIRHAQAYRRRVIPYDTGRLQASLCGTWHPERKVTVTQKGISIGTEVPYAQYQKHRIRALTSTEMKYIFIEPVLLLLQEVLAGRRE